MLSHLAVYRGVGALFTAWIRLQAVEVYVAGLHHVPRDRGAVIASNHVGYLDFAFIDLPLLWTRGELVRFVSRKDIFEHWLVGPFLRAMGQIEVDPFGSPATAYTNVVSVLQAGGLVAMHPEGTISPSFVPLRGMSGAVRMATAAGAPVIPTAIWGSQRLLTKWQPRRFPRHVAVTVRFGAPFVPDPTDHRGSTQELMARIAALVEVSQDLYPQQPRGPDDRWWLPAHRGGTAPTPEVAAARLAEQHALRRQSREAGRS